MMPKGKRSRRGRRGRRGQQTRERDVSFPFGHQGDEFIPFSIEMGTSVQITISKLQSLPPNVNWRPLWMTATAITAYVPAPANDSFPGYFCPSALEMSFYDPEIGNIVSTSYPRILAMFPTTIRVAYPPSATNVPYNLAGGVKFALVNSLCLGKAGNAIKAYVRGLIRVHFQYSWEIISPTCPSSLQVLSNEVEEDDDVVAPSPAESALEWEMPN